MLKKSYSQKVARIFEIVNYFLAPVTIAFSVLTLYYVPIVLYIVLPIWMLCSPGLWLAVQYFKHSRGDLDEEKIPVMWIATIVFNGFFLLIITSLFYRDYSLYADSVYPPAIRPVDIVCVILASWWISAILLSLTALRSESRPKNSLLK